MTDSILPPQKYALAVQNRFNSRDPDMTSLTRTLDETLGRDGIRARVGLWHNQKHVAEFQLLSEGIDTGRFTALLQQVADATHTDLFVSRPEPEGILHDTNVRIRTSAILQTR